MGEDQADRDQHEEGGTMQKKFVADIGQPIAARRTRTVIRLKHSLPAGSEIHAVLPDTLDELEELLKRGELKRLKAKLKA
jgi:hypothetical protein